MKQYSYMIIMIVLFVAMLCFPQATFSGATSGLLLWFQIILPTLLPFIILSNLLIHTNSVYYISNIIKPFIQKVFSISDQACYAVFVGFLCGYPMGAKVVADLINTNRITRTEGQYLLSFCNNTSPMFIISYIVMGNFQNSKLLFGTLLILYLAPIICSFLFRHFYKTKNTKSRISPFASREIYFDFQIFDTCIMNGFEIITKVGGYIILFSVLFSLCRKLPVGWLLPTLEVSNGIPYILHSGLPLTITYPLVLALTSFGGFCAVAQTNSMIQECKISIFPYIIQKLITALVTSLFAFIYIQFIH